MPDINQNYQYLTRQGKMMNKIMIIFKQSNVVPLLLKFMRYIQNSSFVWKQLQTYKNSMQKMWFRCSLVAYQSWTHWTGCSLSGWNWSYFINDFWLFWVTKARDTILLKRNGHSTRFANNFIPHYFQNGDVVLTSLLPAGEYCRLPVQTLQFHEFVEEETVVGVCALNKPLNLVQMK